MQLRLNEFDGKYVESKRGIPLNSSKIYHKISVTMDRLINRCV